MEEAKLSPEEFGRRLDVSGMTIRRWAAGDRKKKLPALYVTALREVVHRLIAEGRLPADRPAVRAVLEADKELPSLQSVLTRLGISLDSVPNSGSFDSEAGVAILAQVGQRAEHRDDVDRHSKWLSGFRRLGKGWPERLDVLMGVVKSPEGQGIHKWVAYGALFYLLMPFDLVPDHIPLIGLMDDFGILGIALEYYRSLTPQRPPTPPRQDVPEH